MKTVRIFVRKNKIDDDVYDYNFIVAEDENEATSLSYKYNYKEINAEKLWELL